uniref:Uncharacterized protein n=1 Tax=Varanus komodoensis TaxID=61221 RepID=A0A8D2L0T0_VARKO
MNHLASPFFFPAPFSCLQLSRISGRTLLLPPPLKSTEQPSLGAGGWAFSLPGPCFCRAPFLPPPGMPMERCRSRAVGKSIPVRAGGSLHCAKWSSGNLGMLYSKAKQQQ